MIFQDKMNLSLKCDKVLQQLQLCAETKKGRKKTPCFTVTLDRHCHPVIIDLFYHDSGVKLTMKDTVKEGKKKGRKKKRKIRGGRQFVTHCPVLSYHPSGLNPLYCINVITLDFGDI